MPGAPRSAPSRGAARSARLAATAATSHLHRSESWNGVGVGDAVVIAGVSGRGTTWRFRAFVVNERNGSETVEVVGGRPGDRTVRSFAPERVFAVTGRSARRRAGAGRRSLAEEPQLPLGER